MTTDTLLQHTDRALSLIFDRPTDPPQAADDDRRADAITRFEKLEGKELRFAITDIARDHAERLRTFLIAEAEQGRIDLGEYV